MRFDAYGPAMPDAFADSDPAASPAAALRLRAIEIRNHADTLGDDDAGERLIALAEEYEAHAIRLERQTAGD